MKLTPELSERSIEKSLDPQECPNHTTSLLKESRIHTVHAYNLTEGSPFTPVQHVPPTFITMQFGQNPLHAYTTAGRWRLDQAARDNRSFLKKSHQVVCRPTPSPILTPLQKRLLKHPAKIKKPLEKEERGDDFEHLIFQFAPLSFLHASGHHLTAYATTPEEAEKIILAFAAKYERPRIQKQGFYLLIKYQRDKIETHSVPLKSSMRIVEDQLELLYGRGCLEWHRQFTHLLQTRNSGISIFEGDPGTGKTTYIRHLICKLEATHRFYFIPTVNLEMLSRPDFIDFWNNQSELFPDDHFVVILEDAENALMIRATDNSRMVSAILNLTDGILADFLHLQFICTLNCSASEIDPALLRPGRLLTHRNFRKLNYSEAMILADSLGKNLTENQDYTLAEIFADPTLDEPSNQRPRIGFGP